MLIAGILLLSAILLGFFCILVKEYTLRDALKGLVISLVISALIYSGVAMVVIGITDNVA